MEYSTEATTSIETRQKIVNYDFRYHVRVLCLPFTYNVNENNISGNQSTPNTEHNRICAYLFHNLRQSCHICCDVQRVPTSV